MTNPESPPPVSQKETPPETIDLTKALVDSLNGPGTFDRNPAVPPPETVEALRDFDSAAQEVGRCIASRTDTLTEETLAAKDSAQARVEQLFREQQEVEERLRGEASGWQDIAEHAERALSSLKDSQLTDSELHFLYGLPLAPGCSSEVQKELDRICESRLRSISSTPAPDETK